MPTLPTDDRTAVQADADAEVEAPLVRQLALERHELGLDREGASDCAVCVILVRDRRAEERQHPVAEELRHGAFEAVDGLEHDVEAPSHERVSVLGIEALRHPGEANDVGEDRGHLLALALELLPPREDLVRELPRRVTPRGGVERLDSGRRCEAAAALRAETVLRLVRVAATRARLGERLSAMGAELRSGGVVAPAVRAAGSRRHGHLRC